VGATFSRIKNWIAETLTYADLNAEIDNILTYLTPSGIDDYSTNAAAMRTQTDPGESGSESLATSLAGELERLRFVIQEMKGTGTTYWYQTASSSLGELTSALGTAALANRISSGRVRTGSSQPLFLVPNGAARTVTLAGATTPFVFYYESTAVTISSNVTATGLTAAPSSNNTALVNMPGTNDEAWTKMCGEYGTTIQVDAMGTEISNLTGKLAGFKLAGSTTEYFIARVDSATQLSNAHRGYFFDSADAPIPRAAFTDNDTITLMKLTWIYAKSDSTLQPGYTNPTVSADEPTSPAIGDYWFDLSASKWKYYSGSWADLDGNLIGLCLQDTTNTVAARGFDFFKNFESTCTADLERASATAVISRNTNAKISVYGTTTNMIFDRLQWSTSTDFDSGVSESASTVYYLYLKESGDRIISNIAPFDRTHDLKGLYHPFHTWRCIGQVYNNDSQDFVACIDYQDTHEKNLKVTAEVASNALTLIMHANPLTKFRINAYNTTEQAKYIQIPSFISLVVASGSTLGHSNATAAKMYLGLVSNNGIPYLSVSSSPFGSGAALTTTAEAGNADSGSLLYAIGALSSVPGLLLAVMDSTQTTAGTWAAVPTNITNSPPRSTLFKVTRYSSGTGTHTTAQGCTRMRLLVSGGGGGGGGSGTGGGGGGSSGGSTTFGSDITAAGGSGGGAPSTQQGGAGGAVTLTSALAVLAFGITGGRGGGGNQNQANVLLAGGRGGENPLGGAGDSQYSGSGTVAETNSGGGGGGGGTGATNGTFTGVGGGAGAYIDLTIPSHLLASSYAYSVGAGGSGGSAGTNGFVGAAGGSGLIVVWEYFD